MRETRVWLAERKREEEREHRRVSSVCGGRERNGDRRGNELFLLHARREY